MAEYWNNHYGRGGSSGEGSVGPLREWKWNTIKKYVTQIDDVIDVGCGDLSFWGEQTCNTYTGIDVSSVIIDRNGKIRPNWKFICAPAEIHQPVRGKIVFCLDMLFHVLSDEAYRRILANLTNYSTELIFIYTWIKNPFVLWEMRKYLFKVRKFRKLFLSLIGVLKGDNLYQKYRDFSNYLDIFEEKGFEHIATEENAINIFGALYVFKKNSG